MRRFWEQLAALWGRLETAQRATIVLVALAFVGIAAALAYGATRPDWRVLARNLDKAEAQEIAVYLAEEKIAYQIVDHGTAILVPSGNEYALRKTLAEHKLLGDQSTGFELLDAGRFGDSVFREQKNYDRAIAGELERSFKTIDGVRGSRVLVVRPQPTPFVVDETTQATASVFLDMEPGRRLKEQQVLGIVRLTAGAVEGLTPDQVEVVDAQGPLTSEDPSSGAAIASTALEAERERETHLMKKAQQLLDRVLGPGRSMVSVAVDLDFSERTEATSDPTKGVVLRETATTSEEQTPVPRAGGVAGTAANIEGAAPGRDSTQLATRTSEDTKRDFVVGERKTTRKDEIGAIQGMTVSILLDYKEEQVPALDEQGQPRVDEQGRPITEAKAVEYTDAEKARFQDMVLGAIGFDAAKNFQLSTLPGQEAIVAKRFAVSVQSLPMHHDRNQEPVQAGMLPTDPQALLEYGRYGAAIVVGLILLFIARGQLKRSHAAFQAEQDRRLKEEEEHKKRQAASANSGEAIMERRLGTKEAIRQQILENPGLAGQVLRRWLYE